MTATEKRVILEALINEANFINEKGDRSWVAYVPVPSIKINKCEFTTDYHEFPRFLCTSCDDSAHFRKFEEFTDEQVADAYDRYKNELFNYMHECLQETWMNVNGLTEIYNRKM
jgi:hypothetical protein